MKYIIVAGGVLSGLGKGITSASIGLLLSSRGIKTTLVKCDMYLNVDAGTMNPLEHGEVFVTHDGLETDQDLGHYERFLGKNLTRANYMTNGQIYQRILEKERALEYEGKCVEPYHVIPPEILSRWENAGKVNKAQVVVVELGGTVGEYEGLLFYEAARRLKLKKPNDLAFVLVGYLPAPPSIGELKSKPLQQSVSQLNALGIQPDFIVARAEKRIDNKRKEKIHLASGVPAEHIIANPDLDTIYRVPIILEEQNFTQMLADSLRLKLKDKDLTKWRALLDTVDKTSERVRIGMIGKYQKTGDYTLADSYVCVVEALKHASWTNRLCPEFVWINSEDLEGISETEVAEKLKGLHGIVVPQGWGKRGTEGKIAAAKFARENNIPYLGLCFGMQMAAIEFGRNVVGLKNANSEEVNPKTNHPVIHIMPHQEKYLRKGQYGGTIRMGAWPAVLAKGSMLEKSYKKYTKNDSAWKEPNPTIKDRPPKTKNKILIFERHRHRYEFNNKYRKRFENKGLVFSALSPDGKLVEAIEIPSHPFFVGTQYHPEYISHPLSPHPLFLSFIKAAKKEKVANR